MSWNNVWRACFRRLASPAGAQCEANIDDELMFHFRSLVDENLAQGMTLDAAWRAAQDRFGSLRHYADECQRAVTGAHPMLQKISAVGLAAIFLVVAWLCIEVRSLRRASAAPPAQAGGGLQLALKSNDGDKTNEGGSAKLNDLAGTVVDHDGKPLADAHVLVILKTWPNNRYQQRDSSGKTDKEGRFRFKSLVPTDGQRAVQLAVVKKGYALKSLYELKKAGETLESDALKLQLDNAEPMTLVVRDSRGRAAAKARVIPFNRKTRAGEDNGVYFQAAKPIEMTADAEGHVDISYFQRGDQAQIYVALPGKDWNQYSVAIPEKGDSIEISTSDAADDKP